MCTKCLKEELMFCAPIPPPKRKGKSKLKKKKMAEGETDPTDQNFGDQQLEPTKNTTVPAAPAVPAVPGSALDLLFSVPMASDLPCLIVIDLARSIQPSLILLDSLVVRLGCYDVIHMLDPEEVDVEDVLGMCFSSGNQFSIMIITSGQSPLTESIAQLLLRCTTFRSCLWVQTSAATNNGASVSVPPPCVLGPESSEQEASSGDLQASRASKSACAILHSLVGKAWVGSMSVHPTVHSMLRSGNGVGFAKEAVVTDELLEEVLLFLWLP